MMIWFYEGPFLYFSTYQHYSQQYNYQTGYLDQRNMFMSQYYT